MKKPILKYGDRLLVLNIRGDILVLKKIYVEE